MLNWVWAKGTLMLHFTFICSTIYWSRKWCSGFACCWQVTCLGYVNLHQGSCRRFLVCLAALFISIKARLLDYFLTASLQICRTIKMLPTTNSLAQIDTGNTTRFVHCRKCQEFGIQINLWGDVWMGRQSGLRGNLGAFCAIFVPIKTCERDICFHRPVMGNKWQNWVQKPNVSQEVWVARKWILQRPEGIFTDLFIFLWHLVFSAPELHRGQLQKSRLVVQFTTFFPELEVKRQYRKIGNSKNGN